MTQPDIYTVEARRRFSAAYNEIAVADRYLQGGYDGTREVKTLAATLRELNWQPPVDPDLVEARKIAADLFEQRFFMGSARECELGNLDATPEVEITLAAIKRGRELERGA